MELTLAKQRLARTHHVTLTIPRLGIPTMERHPFPMKLLSPIFDDTINIKNCLMRQKLTLQASEIAW